MTLKNKKLLVELLQELALDYYNNINLLDSEDFEATLKVLREIKALETLILGQ